MRFFTTRASRIALAAALALGGSIVAAHADPKVLAKIDGTPITEQDVADALGRHRPRPARENDPAERQKYVLDYLIDLKLVAQQGRCRQGRPAPNSRAISPISTTRWRWKP